MFWWNIARVSHGKMHFYSTERFRRTSPMARWIIVRFSDRSSASRILITIRLCWARLCDILFNDDFCESDIFVAHKAHSKLVRPPQLKAGNVFHTKYFARGALRFPRLRWLRILLSARSCSALLGQSNVSWYYLSFHSQYMSWQLLTPIWDSLTALYYKASCITNRRTFRSIAET